jgi:hypothetical protein
LCKDGFAEHVGLSQSATISPAGSCWNPPPEPAARPVVALDTAGLGPSHTKTGRRFQGMLKIEIKALLLRRESSDAMLLGH